MADDEKSVAAAEGQAEPGKDFWTLCVKGTVEEIKEKVAAERIDVTQPFHDGITPLYLAAQNNSLAVVQYFLDAGGDVNARTTGEHGADPMATNAKGWTPLRLARYHVRGKEMLQLLIKFMKLEPAENGRSYEGTIEYVDLWSKRCYQLCGNILIEHSMERLSTSNISLGETDRITYGSSQKRKAVVVNTAPVVYA